MLPLSPCSTVWILSPSIPLNTQAPFFWGWVRPDPPDKWLVLHSWGCCAVRTRVSLTLIPPTTHQIGQGGIKWEIKKVCDTMVQDISSFLASVKVSDMAAFLPMQNYCWLFLCYHSRTFKKEKIFNSSLLTQTKEITWFCSFLARRPTLWTFQNKITWVIVARGKEHGNGAIWLHAAAPSSGMCKHTCSGTTGTFRGAALDAEKVGRRPWQKTTAGSIWDNLLTRNNMKQ